ncbi:hypothetical protein PBRA_003683 [Plasmodiophora brassicae]|uniref:Sphingomyelin synthase-like domain-containing protein n=1 Tax=Plasmodiophora brassicae TaxID=37360 RepID=A0A0G4IIG5_PLABS|nr:hypothetical protein PBRA_003683 [Plasmodiophora brassicae]
MPNYVSPHAFCRQNVFSAVYFLAALYFNAFMQIIISQMDDPQGPRLPDVGYQLLSNASISTMWPNIMVVAVGVSAIIRLLCDRYRARTIRRWAFLQGTMFFLRGVSISVTRLPNPDNTCTAIVPKTDNAFIDAFKVIDLQIVTCRDVLFSGHTTSMMLSALLVQLHTESMTKLARWLSTGAQWLIWAEVVFGIFTIVASKFHYTIDVVIAICLSSLLSWFYFALVRLHKESLPYEERNKELFGNGPLFGTFIIWLERIHLDGHD